MLDSPQPAFLTTQLDPELLSTSFMIQTSWHVVTGPPCCGKSTLIDLLAASGYRTIPETARQYIESQLSGEAGIHPVYLEPAALQRKLKELQAGVENGLQEDQVLFLDGALPSSLAWYRVYGLDPNELLPDCFLHRYASIFLLDPLPFEEDGERVPEMASLVSFLEEWQDRDYSSLGYSVIRVPVLPPEARLGLVLDCIGELE